MPHLTASSSTSTVRPPNGYGNGNRHGHGYGPAIGGLSRTASLAPSASSSPALSLTPSTSKAHGVRAHLAEILPIPRHALFAVRLTIHQLWNVPLVAGEFSVKWKFQHVHKVRIVRHENGSNGTNGNRANGKSAAATATNGNGSAGSMNGVNGSGNDAGKGKGKEKAVTKHEHDADHDSLTPSMLSIPSTSEGSSSSSSLSPRANSIDLTEKGDTYGRHNENGSAGAPATTDEFLQEARGRTPYVELREHNVKWGQPVNIVVQMGVHRDTMDLQPSELKLVVEQLSIPGDPDAPQNPRLGAVYLNLAEYVDKGSVTRRYLLRQSKTNATLQLTIELAHVGGETTYKAPPLQKGEVMAGVATLLEKNPYDSISRHGYNRTTLQPSLRGHRHATDNGSRSGFPQSRSPLPELGSAGLRTTDNIIEAIFNPVPTSSPAPSPFTYYVPPKPRPPALSTRHVAARTDSPTSAVSGDGDADADTSSSLHGGRPPSLAPSAHSERSLATSASHSSTGTGDIPRQKWWQRFGGTRSQSSPHPRSPSPGFAPGSLPSTTSSVRSSSNTYERAEDRTQFGMDDYPAPQIVVRSPTSKSPPSISSESWSHHS
ncbi:hypothetical protein M0805_000253 [Coniferiporia weirii]|nr:hypothetical protein M0805_000253 [Coniferiporia weirii]